MELDITKLEKIAAGLTAEVYVLDDDKVVKVFYDYATAEVVEGEYNANKLVASYGVSMPAVYDLVTCEGRRGIVFERLQNRTLNDIVTADNDRYEEIALTLAREHAALHAVADTKRGLRSFKDDMSAFFDSKPSISEQAKLALHARLDSLPDGDRVLHGDFHPSNLMAQGDKVYIIDWAWTLRGNPAADVAGTVIVMTVVGAGLVKLFTPGEIPVTTSEERFVGLYLDEYMRLTGMTRNEIDAWLPIRAAALTDVGMPEPINAQLLEIIHQGLQV